MALWRIFLLEITSGPIKLSGSLRLALFSNRAYVLHFLSLLLNCLSTSIEKLKRTALFWSILVSKLSPGHAQLYGRLLELLQRDPEIFPGFAKSTNKFGDREASAPVCRYSEGSRDCFRAIGTRPLACQASPCWCARRESHSFAI